VTATSVDAPPVVRLPAADAGLTAVIGGKGRGLDRMLRAGFPVPSAAAITTQAYRLFAEDPIIQAVIDQARRISVPAGTVDQAFLAAPIQPDLADQIAAGAREVGRGGPIAVRSSASVEDMASLSFAGQYHSSLDVDSTDPAAVLQAVRLTWASLWHPAPCAYRRTWGIADEVAMMAVVLMRMVDAQIAGVMFTLDPASGVPRMRIEAVTGLADVLVSGERTPTVWLVSREPPTHLPANAPEPLAELIDLGRRAEQVLGSAQDIEWAWDGGRVWLVQSRPITTLTAGDGCDSPPSSAELMSMGLDEMLPGVLPPLVWDVNAFLIEEALRHMFDVLGANPQEHSSGPGTIVKRVRGRAAVDLDLFKAVATAMPGVSERELEHEYFGTPVSPGPPAGQRHWTPLRDLRVFMARQRAITEAETVLVAVDELARVAPVVPDLDDHALLHYRFRLLDLGARAMAAELAVAAAAAAAYRRLEHFLARFLTEHESVLAAQNLTTGAGIAYPLSEHSSRSVFGGPTWQEAGVPPPSPNEAAWPDRVTDRRHIRDGIEARLRRHRRWRRVRALTGQVIDVQLRSLRAATADAATGLARRERLKAAVLAVGGRVREVHVELGRRLNAKGILPACTDVDLLRDAELRQAVTGRAPPTGVLTLRRRWLDRYERAGPLPQRFIGVPPLSPLRARSGQVLSGWAASGGQHTGRARVLVDPQPAKLEPGDVLVARATDAAWTPVFVAAGAIVVERGGPLSHAAVVARELGLPAVLNVTGAADFLDGRTVTVDGDRGRVVVHDNDGNQP
jgi:pyruvate,water dikinase